MPLQAQREMKAGQSRSDRMVQTRTLAMSAMRNSLTAPHKSLDLALACQYTSLVAPLAERRP